MDSTLTSTRTDPLFDDGTAAASVPNAAPTVAKDSLGGVEETLARLARQAASDTPDARPRAPAADKSADVRVSPSSSAAPTLGPAELSSHMLARERSPGKRSTLARVVIVGCVIAAAIWAWRSYGGPASEVIAALAASVGGTSAHPVADQNVAPPIPDSASQPADVPRAVATPVPPPAQAASMTQPATPAASQAPSAAQPAAMAVNEPAATSVDHQQMETMARDLAALRQTIQQLSAGQEQLKGEIAKLQTEKPVADQPAPEKPKKHPPRHVASRYHTPDAFNPAQDPNAPGAPRAIGSVVVHRPAPQYAPGVSTIGPVSPLPPPQEPGVRRPPMPVPQQP
jgi:hypothetical protein